MTLLPDDSWLNLWDLIQNLAQFDLKDPQITNSHRIYHMLKDISLKFICSYCLLSTATHLQYAATQMIILLMLEKTEYMPIIW